MKRTRWILAVLLVILAGITVRVFLPPYLNMLKQLPVGNYSATEIFEDFTNDPTGAWLRLAGKPVVMEGEVSASGKGFAMLGKDMFAVKCTLRNSIYDDNCIPSVGDKVVLKGICQGLNMTEVLVTHCVLITKSGK